MPRRKQLQLLYLKNGRYYANLRAYAGWGGKCEALIAEGERFATKRRAEAEALLTGRLAELERAKRRDPHPVVTRATTPRERGATLSFGVFAEHAIDSYEATGRGTARHAKGLRQRARAFAAFLGPRMLLDDVTEAHISDFLGSLAHRGLSEPSQRHYLNGISVIYRRAKAEGVLRDRRFNPASEMDQKPRPSAGMEAFLEMAEAALMLDTGRILAERSHPSQRRDADAAYLALATALLTGGRRAEVLGLLVSDCAFRESEECIHFTARADRRLKTKGSQRRVPMFPQLRDLLHDHLNRRELAVISGTGQPSRFVFPGRTGDTYLKDCGKSIYRMAVAAGLGQKFEGDSFRLLRRTFASTRLQCTDGGAPIAEYVVEKELGHGSGAMLRRVYGRVSAQYRHRAPIVEYRLATFTGDDSPLSTSRKAELVALVADRDKRIATMPYLSVQEPSIATR